jgi:hypothetical protein
MYIFRLLSDIAFNRDAETRKISQNMPIELNVDTSPDDYALIVSVGLWSLKMCNK